MANLSDNNWCFYKIDGLQTIHYAISAKTEMVQEIHE
jgi:hypothetical protein